MRVHKNRWLRMEHLLKMDDMGGNPISGNLHIAIEKWSVGIVDLRGLFVIVAKMVHRK